MLRKYLLFDLQEAFSGVRLRDEQNLVQVMKDIYAATGHSFVILIDEWDCLFREYQNDKEAQKKYLDFLRAWLKDKEYVACLLYTSQLNNAGGSAGGFIFFRRIAILGCSF